MHEISAIQYSIINKEDPHVMLEAAGRAFCKICQFNFIKAYRQMKHFKPRAGQSKPNNIFIAGYGHRESKFRVSDEIQLLQEKIVRKYL